MISEAHDFLAESEAIYELINSNTDKCLQEVTAFKEWTLYDVIRHLHVWNEMAYFSLCGKDKFDQALGELMANLQEEGGLRVPEAAYLGNVPGSELLDRWIAYARELAAAFADADAEQRVPWAGPVYERAIKHNRKVDGNLVPCPGYLRPPGGRATKRRSHS